MKVLITGGAGYIGLSLTRVLLREDTVDEVVIYDNLSRGTYNFFFGAALSHGNRVRLVEADVLDTRKLREHLLRTDVVVHLAARVTTPLANSDPHFFEQTNNWGTAELVYAAERVGLQKLIYVSSTSVYGASSEERTESSPVAPTTYYSTSKSRGEQHVRRLGETVNAIVLRLANVYGFNECMRFDAAINRMLFDANFKRQIKIHGSGSQYRAFIHIDNVSKILMGLLFADVPSGTYHAVDRNLRISEVAEVLRSMYPQLDLLYTEQHLSMPELRVSTETSLRALIKYPDPGHFESEMREFREKFTF